MLLYDKLDNPHWYSTDDLSGMGINPYLEITGQGDLNPPQLVNFSFTPTGVDTIAGDQAITFTWEITDDLVGLQCGDLVAYVRFFSPSDGQFRDAIAYGGNLISGDGHHAVFQATTVFPQ